MPEILFDETPNRRVWVTPDETGVTLRTQYKHTQDVLDANARARADTSKTFGNGSLHHIGRVPMELYEQWVLEFRQAHPGEPLGQAFNQFLVAKLRDRDYSQLKTREVTI